jgi:hypothetical protein
MTTQQILEKLTEIQDLVDAARDCAVRDLNNNLTVISEKVGDLALEIDMATDIEVPSANPPADLRCSSCLCVYRS